MKFEKYIEISKLPKQRAGGGSNGGKILRQKSINAYLNSPNTCANCGDIIQIPLGVKVSQIQRRKFCSQSCAASYNNRGIKRNGRNKTRTKVKCGDCGKDISYGAKRCNSCRAAHDRRLRGERTKGEVFMSATNWQSARSYIQSSARKTLIDVRPEMKCVICGYDYHVDCCHKIAVSDWDDSAKINEINSADNLVWLCPNHHVEFDTGYLKL